MVSIGVNPTCVGWCTTRLFPKQVTLPWKVKLTDLAFHTPTTNNHPITQRYSYPRTYKEGVQRRAIKKSPLNPSLTHTHLSSFSHSFYFHVNMAPIDNSPADPNAPLQKKPISYKNLALGASKYIINVISPPPLQHDDARCMEYDMILIPSLSL